MTLKHRQLADATLFPLWLDNPVAPAPTAPLIGRADADLLIVGGGFTGLWAAIMAKETDPGRDVMLIEAGRVAHGASGRPGGIVSTSVMHGLANAARVFPKDLAVLERLGIENLDGWERTIAAHGIDAELEWGGEMTVAITTRDLPKLQEEYDLHRKNGHDVQMLDRAAVQAEVASPVFQAGLWSRERSGTVNPAKLAWGMRALALKLGVRLHEQTPMERVEEDGPALRVTTHDGKVRAAKVLFGTNAWCAGHRHIRRRIIPLRDRVIATEPLTAEQLGRLGWVNRQGIYDTRTQLNYMRLTADNRIVYGGRVGYYMGGPTDPAGDRQIDVYDRLAGYFLTTFPQLDDVRFSHAWSGPIDMSTRLAVHLQRYFGGRGVYAGGYSGFGITASRFGARLALSALDGKAGPEMALALANSLPNRIPPEPFRWLGSQITFRALDEVDTKGGWRKPWIKLIHAMGFPL